MSNGSRLDELSSCQHDQSSGARLESGIGAEACQSLTRSSGGTAIFEADFDMCMCFFRSGIVPRTRLCVARRCRRGEPCRVCLPARTPAGLRCGLRTPSVVCMACEARRVGLCWVRRSYMTHLLGMARSVCDNVERARDGRSDKAFSID